MGELRPGDRLGDYEIRERVAEGGMGRIYKAWDVGLDRFVAIKVITGPAESDEQFRRRFRNEALHLASVDHPNVIPIYGVGETEGGDPYLAMKFVDGTDLDAHVKSGGPLDPELAIDVVEQVARALDAAHREGLVHRDVKPANVLLAGTGAEAHAYLADFGLTKATEGTTELTLSGEWMGTAGFAAPEQIEGDEVGPATDVYSLGCVLYFCLAGEPPFSGPPARVMWAHVNHPLPALPPQVPHDEALDGVIQKATAKDPRQRWTSAGELARAATQALNGTPSAPATTVAYVPEAEATEPMSTAPPPPPPAATTVMRRRRRWPFVAAAGLAAISALAIAFALGAFEGSSPTGDPAPVAADSDPPDATEDPPPEDGEAVAEEASPTFVRTSLDPESGATAILPQGRRSLESFGPRRQRTRVDLPTGAVAIVDYTPQDAPNPGTGYSTTGNSISNENLGATAAEYATRDCQDGSFCVNYPLDLGGYGFGVLGAADSQREARSIARRAARTLEAPAGTLQPPDVVDDCVSEFAPNVSDLSVRNIGCAEADALIVAVIEDLRPGTFESAGFTCQILGRYGPPDGPILGAENIRCAQGDRAFRFSWGD